MRAHASVRAAAGIGGGPVRLVQLRSEAPLVLRQTPDALFLVGAAGGPLGGDELSLDIVVEPGAELVVCSAAATLVQPGPVPSPSRLTVQLHVCDGASLRWQPEPLVSVRGSEHHSFTHVTLEGSAALVLVEELVLGRHEERSGRVRSHIRVVRDGRPVLTHTLDVGADAPAWGSAAVIGDARAVVTELRCEPHTSPVPALSWHDPLSGARAARLPLVGDRAVGSSVMVLALGSSLSVARAAASAVR